MQGAGKICFFLGLSLLLHGAWFLFSPPVKEPRPVSTPMEIGLRQLPKDVVSSVAAPAPAVRSATELPVSPTPRPQRQVVKEARPQTPVAEPAPRAETLPTRASVAPVLSPGKAAVVAIDAAVESAAERPSAGVSTNQAKPVGDAALEAALIDAIPLAGENPPPAYPRLARQRGWEGLVALRVRISAAGEVEDASVEQSSGHGVLDQAALAAVKTWRFRPAQEGRRAVAGVARVPIEFRLRGG